MFYLFWQKICPDSKSDQFGLSLGEGLRRIFSSESDIQSPAVTNLPAEEDAIKKKRCWKTGNALEAASNMNILCLWNLFFPKPEKEAQVHRFQSRL